MSDLAHGLLFTYLCSHTSVNIPSYKMVWLKCDGFKCMSPSPTLQDCVTFAKLVQEAVPILCQLLVSKTNSDVLEAVSFFVSAFEFGVTNSQEGVRKMMVLVWSKEEAVKEAVVAAYRQLYLNPEGANER